MHLTPSALRGEAVVLQPLSEDQLPEIKRAALSAPDVWRFIPYSMRDAADVEKVIRLALAMQSRGEAISFGTRLASTGELIGGTSIRCVDAALPSVEVGGTWIVPAWQRTRVNTEAKLLQLTHGFEQLGCQRIELKTDVRNLRSQAAIQRIGGTREGVLRSHMRRADGSLRDSVLFSILASEWAVVKERLLARLASAEGATLAVRVAG
ncbi:GNAT family N-acetyltransferase [Sorangium sp. So ce124]|uniref:GNAT family N-acetyltransferase n=1 Tax=Sorangium sp. So ce124 TaxID=3133280 RepID=UPI003F618E46